MAALASNVLRAACPQPCHAQSKADAGQPGPRWGSELHVPAGWREHEWICHLKAFHRRRSFFNERAGRNITNCEHYFMLLSQQA